MGDQNATHTHLTPTYTSTSSVRTFPMSEEDGVADCSHMIFGVRWSPEFSVIEPQIAGPARRSYPCLGHILRPEAAFSNAPPPDNASDTVCPEAAFSNAPPPGNGSAAILNGLGLARRSYPFLEHILRLEAAFSNASLPGNVSPESA